MSQSPRESEDVEPAPQTLDENEQQQDIEQTESTDQQNTATVPNETDISTMNRQDEAYDFEVKEQDRWLPIANVARIMKTALPENAKIAKEAKECMQECVSEFISFITSEASEKCQQEKRKTVNGEDILFAMTSLGFENYGEALKIYLARYRETMVNRSDQRPSTSGAGATVNTTTAGYDANNHNVLSGQLDGTAETAESFGYDVTHTGATDY